MISGIAACNKSTEIDYSKGCPKRKVHSRGAKIVSDADLSNPGFFDVTNFAFESIKLWLEVGKLDFTEFVVKGAEFTHCLFNSIGDYYNGAARFSFPKNRKQNMANLQTEIERIMRLCNGDVNRLKAMLLEDDKRLMTLSDA